MHVFTKRMVVGVDMIMMRSWDGCDAALVECDRSEHFIEHVSQHVETCQLLI